jgi:hypothetical protein
VAHEARVPVLLFHPQPPAAAGATANGAGAARAAQS